jgi:DNA-binding CsgD family transcriptional regulator
LTDRELQIVICLFNGIDENQRIADLVGLSVDTVKSHLRNVYRKTGVNSKLRLVLYLLDATGLARTS